MNYCRLIWDVEPCVKPDYYKKKTSRTRSRSYPHLSQRSQSDESIGLRICCVCDKRSFRLNQTMIYGC